MTESLRWRAAAGVLVAAVTLAAFWPVLDHGFVDYDDRVYVTDNPQVTRGLDATTVGWALTTFHASNWHPLTWLSHALDWELFGARAGGHHATSLLLHLANAVLLFVVLERMTGATGRCAFVAALFAVHPLHVESVAWVAERKDVLSTLFWMLATWGWVRYTRKPGRGRYALVLAAFALGLASKPMVVTLPFVFLLLDVWPLGRVGPAGGPGRWVPLVREKIPLFVLSAASCAVTFAAQRAGEALAPASRYPPAARLANAVVAWAGYLRKTLWPVDLAVFYPHPADSLPPSRVLVSALVLAAITAAAVALRRRRPYLLVGWLWYVGTLVPVIGLVQVGEQAMADRYTYVPLVGVFVMVTWGVPDALGLVRSAGARAVDPRWLAAPAAVAIGLCAVGTRLQLRHWTGPVALFERAVAVTRGNWVAHNNLGIALRDRGRTAEAAAQFEAALRARPDDASTHYNLGLLLAAEGDLPGAIRHFREALRVDPRDAAVHNNLGSALARSGDLDGALARFSEAVRLDPGYARAHANLAGALLMLGRLPEAREQLARARALGFDPPEALVRALAGDARGRP